MGFFRRIKQAASGPDAQLMQHGLLGRGLVVALQPTNTSVSFGAERHRVCDLGVQIFLDGQQPYIAQVRQRIPEWMMAQMTGSVVAVRVAQDDHQRAAVDFQAEAPVVTLGAPPAGQGAAHLIAVGQAAEAVVVANSPLGVRSFNGAEIHVFTLTVIPPGQAPYQAQVGIPVPPDALPLVFPGARLPVKYAPGGPNNVTIDWAATPAA